MCASMRGGMVALSPRRFWTYMKTHRMRPKPRRQPQTLLSCQGWTDPPHCSASSKQTMADIRKSAPRKSFRKKRISTRLLICAWGPPTICLSLSFVDRSVRCRAGFLKKKNTLASAAPPNGRLIQKHHRHDTLSVSTPPKIGPTTDAIPNMEESEAMKMALLRRETLYPIMVIPPENKAAAPAPATARPQMSMTEFLAVAHKTEPSSNMSKALRYVHLMLKCEYTFPNDGCKEVVVSR